MPTTKRRSYPVILLLPSYGNTNINIPYDFANDGFAVLTIQIHGYDVEGDNYPRGDDISASLNLDDPNTYYLRNAIAHSIRALDFLFTRDEIDTTRIAIAGTSQGGGLALLLSGLDKRIKFTAALIPTLVCFPESYESGCCSRVRRSIQKSIVSKTVAMKTLSYFDANNMIENINIPILLSSHFNDRISPPNTIFALYNRLAVKDRNLIIYPKLKHEFPSFHWSIARDWLKARLIKSIYR